MSLKESFERVSRYTLKVGPIPAYIGGVGAYLMQKTGPSALGISIAAISLTAIFGTGLYAAYKIRAVINEETAKYEDAKSNKDPEPK